MAFTSLVRSAHRLWACVAGYFWLPCPSCGREFGGHEWRGGVEAASRRAVCPSCARPAGPWYVDPRSSVIMGGVGPSVGSRERSGGREMSMRVGYEPPSMSLTAPVVYRPGDVELLVEHQRSCLCVLNEDGSVRAVELCCISAYFVGGPR